MPEKRGVAGNTIPNQNTIITSTVIIVVVVYDSWRNSPLSSRLTALYSYGLVPVCDDGYYVNGSIVFRANLTALTAVTTTTDVMHLTVNSHKIASVMPVNCQ